MQFPSDISKMYGVNPSRQITIEEIERKSKIPEINIDEIPKEYREIYKLLYEPLSASEISIKTKLDLTEVYSILLMMELKGYIRKYENKYVILEGKN